MSDFEIRNAVISAVEPEDPAVFSGAADPWPIIEAGEIYLELARVDLDDESSILAFVRRFGLLEVEQDDFAAVGDVPWLPLLRTQVARERELAGNPQTTSESLSAFRFGVRTVRDLFRARRILEGEVVLPESWESIPPGETPLSQRQVIWSIAEGREPDTLAEARSLIESRLTSGLSVFHPRVRVDPPDLATWGGRSPAEVMVAASLYSICCLEIFNHLLEQAHYRRCAKESCERVFVRHRGRSDAGQHKLTGGVKYCSNACARAEASRAYRRSKSQEGQDDR